MSAPGLAIRDCRARARQSFDYLDKVPSNYFDNAGHYSTLQCFRSLVLTVLY